MTKLRAFFLPALILLISGKLLADEQEFSREHQFVFFAVVEGLYADGLSNSSLEAILGTDLSDNFVYSCPICTPAYDAFRLFQTRPNLTAKKKILRDFGSGLNIEERKLLAGTPVERRTQIRALISRWIEARIKKMNLSDEKEKELREELRKMSDEGTETLERLKNSGHGDHLAEVYKDWEFCPSCEGVTLHGKKDSTISE